MRKSLTKKDDTSFQIRLTDEDCIILDKIAEEETRTTANLVKHAVLVYIRMDKIASSGNVNASFNKWYKALKELDK